MLIDGVMLLWFILTGLSLVFVAVDIRNTPEHPVMKWAFVLFTAYAGVFGAFLYVLGCREPLPGLHERYVAARWRQTLGSTMHCVAGDGIGILVGAVIGAAIALPLLADFALEYVLGFLFGWTIFQALGMKDMFAGNYQKALKATFSSELLSMNCLMGGMLPVSALAFQSNPDAHDPTEPLFWFRMSLALMVGAAVAYPMNWWLVAHHLKHGMLTVRPAGSEGSQPMQGTDMQGTDMQDMDMSGGGTKGGGMEGTPVASLGPDEKKAAAAASGSALHKPSPPVWVMAVVSFAVMAAGVTIAIVFSGR